MVHSSGGGSEGNLSTDHLGAAANARNALGQELAEIAAATFQLAAELRPMLDDDAAALDKLVQDGERDACRIAVIGQVKAGKSTLVNALIRRPGFLPADVNPWTAVVTNLHFGRQSNAGAVYQFFDETDWQHLAAGGRLLELSQRLGGALDADTLARQVRLMRERAEDRLGQQFQQLLGKQHRFASASSEVLERYVCVGDLDRNPAGGSEPKLGRFADITKSADLYFDLPPFAYPTTIVDTPGTNDPFLVRDELSREALKNADAYIIVLNAQQALSSSDLDLLRLLHGLQKRRLVIFVNRIDLLANPVTDGELVVAHIRGKLAIEFPGVAIPVIAGSAKWAESLASEQVSAETADRRGAIQALRRRIGLRSTTSDDAAIWRTEVMRSSGLDGLVEILSRLIVQGPAMLRLQRRQNALRDMVSKFDFAARSQLLSLELRISSARDDEAARARRQAKVAEELQRLDKVPEAVAKLIDAASSDLGRAKDSATQRLGGSLRDIIRRHATTARETLLAQSRFTRHDHIWQYHTLPLRRDLEHRFQTIYLEAAEELRSIERKANAEILNEVGDLVPANTLLGEGAPVYMIDPEPSISALGQTMAIELDDQWRAWWRLWHGQKQRARKLEELLIAEFRPVVEALADAAEAELDAHVVISVQRFSQSGRDLIAVLSRRRLDLEADRQDERKAEPGALIREYRARQKQLEQHVRDCTRIADALKVLVGRCAALRLDLPAEAQDG
jgi:signal recognition particle receptor subunit beta